MTRTALPPVQPARRGATRSPSSSAPTTRSSSGRCRPSLLVNERAELVHAFGGAERFLQHRDGRQGLDVLELVEPGAEDGPGRRRSSAPSSSRRRSSTEDVRISRPGAPSASTRSRSSASAAAAAAAPHLLVSFEQTEPTPAATTPARRPRSRSDQVSRDRLRALEAELAHTKENLQAAIEELETSNEELQATQRGAPDEQRGAPEHERGAPERQRGALHGQRRVPAQDRRADRADERHGQPPRQHGDRDDLPRRESSRSGSSRRQIAKAFSLVPHDVGRSIETFVHQMKHPELVEDLHRVLADRRAGRARAAATWTARPSIRGSSPTAPRGRSPAWCITLIDVSGLKSAEDALFHERYLLNSLLASTPDAIYFKDQRGRLIRANDADGDPAGPRGSRRRRRQDGAGAAPTRSWPCELHRKDEAVLRTGETHHYKLERIGPPGARRPRATGIW